MYYSLEGAHLELYLGDLEEVLSAFQQRKAV